MNWEKILTGLVIFLVVVALSLIGVLQWVKARGVDRPTREQGAAMRPGDAPNGPPSGSDGNGLPISANTEMGPYEPWPVSFPKVLPGFFMLEDQAPRIKLSRTQAQQLLPVIEEMGQNWKTVHSVEIKIKERLTKEQRAWITRVKHQVEMSTAIKKVMAIAGPLGQGENASVKAVLNICEKRSPDPVPASLAAAAEKERHRELGAREYEQQPGEEWLTVFDECTAFALIEQEHPELRITSQQAVYISGILQEVVVPLKVVSRNEGKMRNFVTAEQIKFVQDNMDLLYKYRTGEILLKGTNGLAFPNSDAQADAHKYHDPLYYETVRFLKRKAEGG